MQGVPPVHVFAGGGLQRATPSRTAASASAASPSSTTGAMASRVEGSGARVLPFRRGLPLVELNAAGVPAALGWQHIDAMRKWFAASEPGWDGVRGGWPFANVVYLGVSTTEDPALPCLAVELPEDAVGDETSGKKGAETGDAEGLGLSASREGSSLRFEELRGLMQASQAVGGRGLGGEELAAAGQARAFLEFGKRTRFCAACGAPCVPVEGGVKRSCILNTGSRGGCRGRFYPRVDPVMICLVVSQDGERCLLGRQAAWPEGMWSCLAGFLEVCESAEDAVRREVMEEAGVPLASVIAYHSSQPWPVGRGNMPAQLMLGFLARAADNRAPTPDPGELEDARWFTRAEAREALERGPPQGAASSGHHPDGAHFIPGPYAIAHHLVREWCLEGPLVSRL